MLVSSSSLSSTARVCGIGGRSSRGYIWILRRSFWIPDFRLSLRGLRGRKTAPKGRGTSIGCSLGRSSSMIHNRYAYGCRYIWANNLSVANGSRERKCTPVMVLMSRHLVFAFVRLALLDRDVR